MGKGDNMPSEPSKSEVEPVGGTPLGEAGTAKPDEKKTTDDAKDTQPTEPTSDSGKEPESAGEDEYDDVSFDDLKTVPKPLQKAAKKLQGTFTKKMNAIMGEATAKAKEDLMREGLLKVNEPEKGSLSPEAQQMKEFMDTPQGAVLKEVMGDIAREAVGDLPDRLMGYEAEKEVENVVKEFGENALRDNYDEIDEVARANPSTPLRMIVSTVLYNKAKQTGAAEERNKIQKKNELSSPSTTSSANVQPAGKAATFEEAFEMAKQQTGL